MNKKSLSISVIVTNWNGYHLIKKSLPQIIKNSPEAIEIILSDDASSDQSVLFVRKLQLIYPQLKLIVHRHNLGFVRNSNFAVSKARGDLIVLLNSDIYPHPNYLQKSLSYFDDPKIFGVGFAEHHKENWAQIFWKDGYLQYQPGSPVDKPHITAWLSGGSSIIRKSIFLKLGGFDEVYSPFYSEDLDLGYRAWKSGYTLMWQPLSVVDHKHEATISKLSKSLVEYVKERNRLLIVWRNITDPQLRLSNRLALFGRVFFGPNYIKIIRAAFLAVHNSKKPIVFPDKTDMEIFSLFRNHE